MPRRRTVALGLVLSLLTAVGALALAGALRDTHLVTVTRTTDADPDVLWRLWSDVPRRTDWDRGLEWIRLDGPFRAGSRGQVKVEGQGPIDYSLVEVVPRRRYTDRFESVLGTHTDWHHTLRRRPDGRHEVTWRLEARGPLGLLGAPALKGIFGEEVPSAVDEYVRIAEARS